MYRGHYYGTSLDSVAEVMAEGKMCLVNLHPAVSPRLHHAVLSAVLTRTSDIMHTVISNTRFMTITITKVIVIIITCIT